MQVIIAKTGLKTIPANCAECNFMMCSLPCSARNNAIILKPYIKKRHKQCPLMYVEAEAMKAIK